MVDRRPEVDRVVCTGYPQSSGFENSSTASGVGDRPLELDVRWPPAFCAHWHQAAVTGISSLCGDEEAQHETTDPSKPEEQHALPQASGASASPIGLTAWMLVTSAAGP